MFYSLNLPETKNAVKPDEQQPIRAMVSVLEGRGTKLRIQTELQYLVDSEWDWSVKKGVRERILG